MINTYDNFDKNPYIEVISEKENIIIGYENVQLKINNILKEDKKIIILIDWYHGYLKEELEEQLLVNLNVKKLDICSCMKNEKDILKIIDKFLTNDRVFGYMSPIKIKDFFYEDKLLQIKKEIEETNESLIIYGLGVNLLEVEANLNIFIDMARWEIQQRFREKILGNLQSDNYDEDLLKKYKRSYFIEWRTLDRYKMSIINKLDYIGDGNQRGQLKLLPLDTYLKGINITSNKPFRLVPFFDQGIWGGQWMKKVCNLPKDKDNYAWCFDCVPEENSLVFKVGSEYFELPAINLVLLKAKELLGEKVYSKFGAEFPIRFDFLDTVGGQNLSLQVHPTTSYIQEKFGMTYTQDESYYILDNEKGAKVYLGLKEGIKPEEFINDLKRANKGIENFNNEKYINTFTVNKHDHFLIPAGTVHCSGSGTMVLEISATPYIFTFKLWDWNRLGLDGLPRPVHLNHGKKVIDYSRDTKWVKENLINNIDLLEDKEGLKIEQTGLHKLQFIETERYTFNKEIILDTKESVNVLNLVDGKAIIIESLDNSFDDFEVHYVETFVVPEGIKKYRIKSKNNKKVIVLRARVRV